MLCYEYVNNPNEIVAAFKHLPGKESGGCYSHISGMLKKSKNQQASKVVLLFNQPTVAMFEECISVPSSFCL
jgi:hypothetical protein